MKITLFIQELKNNRNKLRMVGNISKLKLKGRSLSYSRITRLQTTGVFTNLLSNLKKRKGKYCTHC